MSADTRPICILVVVCGWRGAAVLALLATAALLAAAGKLSHLHGRWVIVAGWVMAGCGLTVAVAERLRNAGAARCCRSGCAW
jgi:hypothetical protein